MKLWQILPILIGIVVLNVLILFLIINHTYNSEYFTPDSNIKDLPVQSYYKEVPAAKFGKNYIIVQYHWTNWCGYCKRMRPIWDQVRAALSGPNYDGITFQENDEDASPTAGVNSYPTIYKIMNGVKYQYSSRADPQELMNFILNVKNVDKAA